MPDGNTQIERIERDAQIVQPHEMQGDVIHGDKIIINLPVESRPASELRPAEAPQIGPLVYKLCNRKNQENDFLKFFTLKIRECPKQPQFYFLHGDEGECHESFIERLRKTHIKEYVEKEWGAQYGDVYAKSVTWPTRGDLATRQDDLVLNFRITFEEWENNGAALVNALSRKLASQKRLTVIITHNLYAEYWDRWNERLLLWYLRKFWGSLQSHHDIPQFLIFLNVMYSETRRRRLRLLLRRRRSSKKYIMSQLCAIHRTSGEPDPCQLLEELNPVTRTDVKEWLSTYHIYAEEEHNKILNTLFSEHGRSVEYKRMEEVQLYLKSIIYTFSRERNIAAW